MSHSAKQLQQIHRMTTREWATAGREIGLSQSEFDYLAAVQDQADLQRLEDQHGQHLQDIVDALGVTKASASNMISKLEKQGLVVRFQCKMDARAQHIILSPQGQILLARGFKVYQRIAQRLDEQ